MQAMVLLVFRGVPHSVLGDIDAILEMEDPEIASERVSNDSLALDKLVHFLLGLLEGFGSVHVMRGHSRDPSPKVRYTTLWLDIFIIQHVTIVVNN
jgi:hypothetical protein